MKGDKGETNRSVVFLPLLMDCDRIQWDSPWFR